ncbi:MAG: zinc-binding alcohol dehydrogenase [Chloroflexi bacterium]|nr:zinc-binding alcohol dehydrogenase [Chloroflexota bacterium]
MNLQSLIFTSPRTIQIQESPIPTLLPHHVLVQTIRSAISAGTEMLIYRGEAPQELNADDTIASLNGSLAFPLKYGYCAVGKIIACGREIDPVWQDRIVFSFNPHETHFAASIHDLIPLPPDLDPDDAVFLPNMETAVNFLHDGAPVVGERVIVLGQGIIGLLTTSLLSHIPLESLITLDRYPLRRELSLKCGATLSLDADECDTTKHGDADLTYELTGAPTALNQAIELTGFSGRVVIGSWYGTKTAQLSLGGRFHRSRIKLISSQVSTLSPELTSRWTKARRFETVLKMLKQIRPSRFITHRFKLSDAAKAYQLLDQRPEETMQVVFDYDSV